MSLRANHISKHGKAIAREYSAGGTEPGAKLDLRLFDIDADTSIIGKCPCGHAPSYAGISKGQTCAHFSHETCSSCELFAKCRSKKQTKDYVVRISLKAIESGSEGEEAKPDKVSAAIGHEQSKSRTPQAGCGKSGLSGVIAGRSKRLSGHVRDGRKYSAVPILRKYGVFAGAAVLCILIGVIALSSGLFQVSDSMAASVHEQGNESTISPEPSGDNIADIEDPFSSRAAVREQLEDTGGGDNAGEAPLSQASASANTSASALASVDASENDISESVVLPEPSDSDFSSDDASETGESVSNGDSAAVTPDANVQGVNNSVPAPNQQNTTQPAPEDDPLPYLIYVSKNSFTIAILGLDEDGNHTKLLHTFSTGTGRTSAQTRAGTFTITSRERWRTWLGPTYTPYSTMHSGGLWFHGPIYSERDPQTLIARSYNEIGTASTAGCLRTTTAAAAWIYFNCAEGTKVIIANDSLYTAASLAKLDASQTYDPTDPDIQSADPGIEVAEPDIQSADSDAQGSDPDVQGEVLTGA